MGCTKSIPAAGSLDNKSIAIDNKKISTDVCGISFSHIQSLMEEHQAHDQTIHEFCMNIIKPLTKNCSYVDYLLTSDSSQKLVKPVADVFISYSWKYRLKDLVAAIKEGEVDNGIDRFLWIDLFLVNQHNTAQKNWNSWVQTFAKSLKVIGKAEFVLIPYSQPIPITRSWCVFEQYMVAINNLSWKQKMLPSDRAELERRIKIGEVDLDFFHLIFSKINVDAAEAQVPEDAKKINELVHKGGVVKVTDIVMSGLKQFFMEVMTKLINETTGLEFGYVASSLAGLYDVSGDERAVTWREKAVEVFKESVGEDSDILATEYNLLSAKLRNVGRVEESLKAIEMSLAIGKKIYEGGDNMVMDTRINNLGLALRAVGQRSEAIENFKEAIAIGERIIGSHKDARIARWINNLALCESDPNEAIKLFRESLQIRLEVLGDMHADVALNLHNLAYELKKVGKEEEAAKLGRQAVSIYQRIHGREHNRTQNAMKMWGDIR